MITTNYKIVLEGNDIDTKKVQKLNPGEKLLLKRINDAEDTFEICVCHADGREIDMLTYAESIGIAPYMDTGDITADATVGGVEIKPGKSRAKDLTILTVNVEYSVAEELTMYTGKNGIGFTDKEDLVLSLAVLDVLKGDRDILADRPYLNMYTLKLPLYEEVLEMPEDFEDDGDSDNDCFLEVTTLFNEDFTKCKIYSALADSKRELRETRLDENEKDTVITLINHARIFAGEDGVNPEIEE